MNMSSKRFPQHIYLILSLGLLITCVLILLPQVLNALRDYRELQSSLRYYSSINAKKILNQENKPVKTIVFVKTHKTASSSLANILHRFGDERDLIFALPRGSAGLGWPGLFQAHDPVPIPPDLTSRGHRYNIISNHIRYNRDAIDSVMYRGAKYITILRDPVTHFESSFDFFNVQKHLNISLDQENGMINFLRSPRKYMTQRIRPFIQNGMFFDLGFDFNETSNEFDIKDAIQKVQKEFAHVFITEYFDESLVLMKRKFHWEIQDILYFKLNQRRKERVRLITNEDMIKRIKEWNNADEKLHEYFNKTLWDEIAQEDDSFHSEVRELQHEIEKMKESCLGFPLVKGIEIISYELKAGLKNQLNTTCTRLIRAGSRLYRALRNKWETKLLDQFRDE